MSLGMRGADKPSPLCFGGSYVIFTRLCGCQGAASMCRHQGCCMSRAVCSAVLRQSELVPRGPP